MGDEVWFLIVPAGVLIALRGILMLTYWDEVLSRPAEDEEHSLGGRVGLRKEHPFGAVLGIVIGVGWCELGLVGGFSA